VCKYTNIFAHTHLHSYTNCIGKLAVWSDDVAK
jgi:hypothetical protein